MPNTLTIVFTSAPSTEPVEFPHPNTGVYVTGTQATAGGPWQAVFTGVTKGAYGALTGRLKNYPAVSATIAASGPVVNIQQTAPGGTSATSSGPNSINVTVNSSINATAYRFFSATAQAGPYSLLVSQASATYNNTGLTTGVTTWYQVQYVGTGFYDDSPPSIAFSGVATAPSIGGVAANDAVIIFINGQSNAQGNAEATEALFAPMDTFSPTIGQSFAMTKIWNVATSVFENMVVGTNSRSDATNTYPQGYTYAAKSDGTWDVGNPAAKYNITGVGPEYGIADAYRSLSPVTPIYIIKFCEGGTSINVWQKGNVSGLYAKLLAHKQNAFAALAGKNIRVLGFYRNQGEADATMTTAAYQTALTQFYSDLTSDTFFTTETKIVEVATPTTNDTGTPVIYSAELAAKQNFVAAAAGRYLLDAGAVALEHDEIHWNLATQYQYGFVRLANLIFGTSIALPASVQPVAPTLSFNSSSSIVTVTPPTTAWPQKEFYYSINGSAPKRLTTSFTFPIPAGVTAASGGVQVFSRAVPGRIQSGYAINTTTWVGVAASSAISWLSANGRFASQDGSGSTTRLYRTGGANAWDAYAPASLKILAPPAGTTNAAAVATLTIPNELTTQSAVVLGVSVTPTIVTKNSLLAGIYIDNQSYGLMFPTAATPDNIVAPTVNYSTQTGLLTLNVYIDRITLSNASGLLSTIACTPFASGQTLYVQGAVYGFAGWATGQQVSQIIGATLTGGTLTAF